MGSTDKDITLDPENWEQTRQLGHEMVDLLIDYHASVRDRKVWKPIPDEMKENYKESLPTEGKSQREVFEEFKEIILPYPTGNIHPRFWGWVHGTGTTFGALAEMLAAMMNPNTGGREHAANYIEREVLNWAKEMLGYEESASGILTSGCSMANLTGLTIARNMKAGTDVRKEGIQQTDKKLTVYGSNQMHSSIQKALEVLGLGSDALRMIDVNDRFEIDLDELKQTISDDRSKGFLPIAIVGNAGTVNSGAFDDFEGLSRIAKEENVWFHIDGAFGALARLVSDLDDRTKGLSLADSIAFDMHKWMYMPYEIGCILVRHPEDHRSTFSLRPDYLSQMQRGLASFDKWPTEYGVELSRGFRALKAWMLLKEHGIDKYSQVIHKNIKQAAYFGELVQAHQKLELLAPISLNIVCFRYVGDDLSPEQYEDVNKELLLRIQESGIAVFSSTYLHDIYALRICVTNQRSEFSDFDLTLDHIVRLGDEIITEQV